MYRSAALYRLQQIDSEIRGRSDRLAQVCELLGETQGLLDARHALESAAATLAALRIRQKDIELVLQGVNAKKQQSEDRLYGGRVHNSKELSDLNGEVNSLGRRVAALEDQLLEILMSREEAERTAAECQERLARIEAEWTSSQSGYLAEKAHQEQQLANLNTERDQMLPAIPTADLHLYEQIKSRRGGLAVVQLVNSECQGCMTGVSVARVKEAQQDTLACCGTCGRILFAG